MLTFMFGFLLITIQKIIIITSKSFFRFHCAKRSSSVSYSHYFKFTLFHLTNQKSKTTAHAGFQYGSFLPQGQDRSYCFWREQKGAVQQGETMNFD